MFYFKKEHKKSYWNIFRWFSVLTFEYYSKMKNIKMKYNFNIKKKIIKKTLFKKKNLKFNMKSYFLFNLKKSIEINSLHGLIFQELQLIINDLYHYSVINKKKFTVLKNIKNKYSICISLKIGFGRIYVIFFIFIYNFWFIGKKELKITLFKSFFLLTSRIKEYKNQIMKVLVKTKCFFNLNLTLNCKFGEKIKKRGYGIILLCINKEKKADLIDNLITKKIQHIIIDQSGYINTLNDRISFSNLFSSISKKKIQIIYIKDKNLVEKLKPKYIFFLNRLNIKLIKNINRFCSTYYFHIFEKSLAKISKLIYFLNKKKKSFIVFLNSKKRCTFLRKIIRKYFTKHKNYTFVLIKYISIESLNKFKRKIILIISNKKINIYNRSSNIDCTINYDIPNQIIIYFKIFDIFKNKKCTHFFFFLIYEVVNYLKIQEFVFGIVKK